MNNKKIDLSKLKDPFPDSDIEWRVAQSGERDKGPWAMVLAYISARAIQDRLDTVVGAENWETKYEFINGKDGLTAGVICRLSIRCGPEDSWVTKEDGAEETDIESFKGGISSALKRAGSAWGIGRYLYNLESGFAEIVTKGTKGARFSMTKDKKPFYWLPPELPRWALPAETEPKETPPPVVTPLVGKPEDKVEAHAKKVVTDWQLRRLYAIMNARTDSGWTKETMEEVSIAAFNLKGSLKLLNMSQYDKLVGWVEKSTYTEISDMLAKFIADRVTGAK